MGVSVLPSTPETGTVVGKVVDINGNPMPGAAVVVIGTSLTAVTDANGGYKILRVPEGRHIFEVSYLGFDPETVEVNVEPRRIIRNDVVLARVVRLQEEVTVVAEPLREGQAKALSQQKNALSIVDVVSSDFIGSFPDSNSAEATQRIPGVSIQRDQGEGRYVLIRGTEARLNAMMLNGEVLPSPEGDIRNVALDVIPSDLLDFISVTKALTPDMDADSIGGAVNLITKTAPEQQRVTMNLGMGYNRISDNSLQNGNFSFGRRFADRKLGLMLGGSYFNTDRGSHNFEVDYDDGYLDDFEKRHYTVNRKRYALAGTMDYQPTLSTKLKLQGMFNQFDDQEYRRRVRDRIGDGEIEREMKDRFESQQIYSLGGIIEQLFSGGIKMEASITYSYAQEDEPDRRDYVFLQEDVEFDPNVTPDSINPANIQTNPQNENYDEYLFDELVVENNLTQERKIIGAANFTFPLAAGDVSALFKTGGKLSLKRKERDNRADVYEAEDDLFFTDFMDSEWKANDFLDGRYDPFGPFMTIDTSNRLLTDFNLEWEEDVEANLGDYNADENTYAGYGMGVINLGRSLTLLPGVRYEYTDLDYTGYQLEFNDEGDFESIQEVIGTDNYGVLLPHFHLQYRLNPASNLRASFNRTLSRPNYFDIVPYRLILREDLEIETGNPTLKPTKSWNIDLMFQHYFQNVGVFSIGGFYKNLADYIYIFRNDEIIEGQDYRVIQPKNGESAYLFGLEANLQRQLDFLPTPLDGLGLILNYTYIDSEAKFPEREGESATLPGQSQHVGNVALSYEKGIISSRLSLNYHGKYIDAVGETSEEDIYYDNHLQLDFRANIQFASRIGFYVEMLNLTNEPLRYYEGAVDRPIQEEYYRFWGVAGLRINF
jgi:TonB-dependent receptor